MEYIHDFAQSHAVALSAGILIIAYIFIAAEKISKVTVALIGACAAIFLGLVSEDKRVAAHQVAIGAPFYVKPIRPEQIEMIRWNAAHYAELAETYRETEKKG